MIIHLVLPTTGDENNVAHVSVTLANPFTAELLVTGVRSNVSTHGIPLGTIEASTNFTSAGRSTTNSPNFDIGLNMEPAALFTVTRLCAAAAGLSTEQLDGIVDIGGYKYLPMTSGDDPSASPKKRGNIYTFVTLMFPGQPIVIPTMNHFVVDSISRTSSMQHSNSCARTSNLKWMYKSVSIPNF